MRLVISGQKTAADAPDYSTAIQLPCHVSCRITGDLNRILLPYSLNPSIACPSWAENIWLEAVLKANEAAIRQLLWRRMKSPMVNLLPTHPHKLQGISLPSTVARKTGDRQ
ncbi:hypothetical protein SAMN05216386_0761 [Nitrosospira briensis]|uniref:Uncharacterized protein n=1 Tax=Nitrosospira briensis TaxID=35799 RepID=A0A1I4YLB8_9PROT|nr:hypothetical protein SAMN05216386_0761 [Nitrosospira briensis]